MAVPIVNACFCFCFLQLILHYAFLRVLSNIRNGKRFGVSLLRDDFADLNGTIELVLRGYLDVTVQSAQVLVQHEGGAYLRRQLDRWLHLRDLEAEHLPVVHQITKRKRLRSTHHIIVALLVKDGEIISLPCFRHGWSEADPRCQSAESLIAQADSKLLSLMHIQLRSWEIILLRRSYLIWRLVLAFSRRQQFALFAVIVRLLGHDQSLSSKVSSCASGGAEQGTFAYATLWRTSYGVTSPLASVLLTTQPHDLSSSQECGSVNTGGIALGLIKSSTAPASVRETNSGC
jgi:hypothetical protein